MILLLIYSCVQIHPEARPYRTKPVLNFDDLCLIYGYTVADGRYSRSSHDVDVEDDNQGVNFGQYAFLLSGLDGQQSFTSDTLKVVDLEESV